MTPEIALITTIDEILKWVRAIGYEQLGILKTAAAADEYPSYNTTCDELLGKTNDALQLVVKVHTELVKLGSKSG